MLSSFPSNALAALISSHWHHVCSEKRKERSQCTLTSYPEAFSSSTYAAQLCQSSVRTEPFPCPFTLSRPPVRNEVPLQRGGCSAGGLPLLADLCWSLATACAQTLFQETYLSDLSLNRQPMETMAPPCRVVAFG